MNRIGQLKSLCLKEHAFAITFLMIAIGIGLRLSGLNFDAGQQLHPDERFLNMTMATIDWPSSTSQYFATETSPLNPTNHQGSKFYVYGNLPLFLGKAVVDFSSKITQKSPVQTLRGFSAFIDIILIVIVFLI